MGHNELIKAISNKSPMEWGDPDPIEGRDYTIDRVTILHEDDIDEDDMCAHIEYGGGFQATVYIFEINLK